MHSSTQPGDSHGVGSSGRRRARRPIAGTRECSARRSRPVCDACFSCRCHFSVTVAIAISRHARRQLLLSRQHGERVGDATDVGNPNLQFASTPVVQRLFHVSTRRICRKEAGNPRASFGWIVFARRGNALLFNGAHHDIQFPFAIDPLLRDALVDRTDNRRRGNVLRQSR